MSLPHAFKRIRLHLARSKDFPSGSREHGYGIVAPLDADGHIDATLWKAHRNRCRVRRFWGSEGEQLGVLTHKPGGSEHARWVFDYDQTVRTTTKSAIASARTVSPPVSISRFAIRTAIIPFVSCRSKALIKNRQRQDSGEHRSPLFPLVSPGTVAEPPFRNIFIWPAPAAPRLGPEQRASVRWGNTSANPYWLDDARDRGRAPDLAAAKRTAAREIPRDGGLASAELLRIDAEEAKPPVQQDGWSLGRFRQPHQIGLIDVQIPGQAVRFLRAALREIGKLVPVAPASNCVSRHADDDLGPGRDVLLMCVALETLLCFEARRYGRKDRIGLPPRRLFDLAQASSRVFEGAEIPWRLSSIGGPGVRRPLNFSPISSLGQLAPLLCDVLVRLAIDAITALRCRFFGLLSFSAIVVSAAHIQDCHQ
jgi:hypothetical protein